MDEKLQHLSNEVSLDPMSFSFRCEGGGGTTDTPITFHGQLYPSRYKNRSRFSEHYKYVQNHVCFVFDGPPGRQYIQSNVVYCRHSKKRTLLACSYPFQAFVNVRLRGIS